MPAPSDQKGSLVTRRVLFFLVTLALFAALAPAAPAAIKFTKVYFDSPGSDTGSNSSLNAEWVRIKNTGSKAKALTGWRIRDKAGHVYKFGTFKLRAGKTVTVHTGSGSNGAAHRYWGSDWYIWNNNGDTAKLRNASGTTIDTCSWGSSGDFKVC